MLAGVKQVRVTQRREAAIQGLIAMDPPPPQAIPVLLQATRSSNNEVVRLAVFALTEYGPDLIPVLRQAYFRDGVKGAAAVLAEFGDPALPVLLEIGEKDVAVRSSTANALRSFGPKAAAALPWLIELLDDPYDGVRISALITIGGMGAEGAPSVPKIVELMLGSRPLVANECAHTLGRIGPRAAAALPELRKLVGRDGYNAIGIKHAISAIEGR